MTQYSALLSIVYMMVFVLLFDRVRWRKDQDGRWSVHLFSPDELERLVQIWSACDEA